MRVAYVYTGSEASAWSQSDGIGTTLRKMGHKVLPFPRGRRECPALTLEVLNQADCILVSGPEHILAHHVQGAPRNTFSFSEDELTIYDWKHGIKVPKMFWYHETNYREDRTFRFEDFLPYADYHFFPAIQDAETYDKDDAKGRCFWLPLGVDLDIFHPPICFTCRGGVTKAICKACLGTGFEKNHKVCPVGFIGMMYPKRDAFLRTLGQHYKHGDPEFHVGNVAVRDIEGPAYEDQVKRLAMNYRKISMFLNMPSYSELLVSKVFEVMACGTFLITPTITGRGEQNMKLFEHAKEIVYYQPTNIPFLMQTLREFASRPQVCETIAQAGMSKVRTNHSLRGCLDEMLSKVESKVGMLQ